MIQAVVCQMRGWLLSIKEKKVVQMKTRSGLLCIGVCIISILVSQLIGCTGSEHRQLISGTISPDIMQCDSHNYRINSPGARQFVNMVIEDANLDEENVDISLDILKNTLVKHTTDETIERIPGLATDNGTITLCNYFQLISEWSYTVAHSLSVTPTNGIDYLAGKNRGDLAALIFDAICEYDAKRGGAMSWYKMSNRKEIDHWLRYAIEAGTEGKDPVMLNLDIDNIFDHDPWSPKASNPYPFQ